jgi:hypothetical protein
MVLDSFPTEKIAPMAGSISCMVFENKAIELTRAVYFSIEVPLRPFDLDGNNVDTKFELEFIHVPVRRFVELSGKRKSFPLNPDPGYVDGSIYLLGAHTPVDLPLVQFADVSGLQMRVWLDLAVAFEVEHTGYRNTRIEIWTTLTFTGARVPRRLLSAGDSADDASRVLAEFMELSDYRPPIQEGDYFMFPPRGPS